MPRNHYMTFARHNACAQLRADDPSAWLAILSQIACRRCSAGGGFVSIRTQEGTPSVAASQLSPTQTGIHYCNFSVSRLQWRPVPTVVRLRRPMLAQRSCHDLHPVIWSVFPGAVIASSGLDSWSCCGRGCMLESLVALTGCLEPRLHADRVLGVTEN